MPSVKKHLKQYLAIIPPIGRLLAERDALRQQVETLGRRMAELRVELKAVRTKFEIPCWVPPGHFYSPIPSIPDLKMNEEELFDLPQIRLRRVSLKRNVLLQCLCQGCNTPLKVEFISEPVRTGAMWTVDCPVCGTSKMIPDDPVKIYYQKDGNWIEARPKSQHFG